MRSTGGFFCKELRASEVQGVLLWFSTDVDDGLIRIVPISSATFGHARRIAGTQTRVLGTRALDILHVASALALEPAPSARLIRIRRDSPLPSASGFLGVLTITPRARMLASG